MSNKELIFQFEELIKIEHFGKKINAKNVESNKNILYLVSKIKKYKFTNDQVLQIYKEIINNCKKKYLNRLAMSKLFKVCLPNTDDLILILGKIKFNRQILGWLLKVSEYDSRHLLLFKKLTHEKILLVNVVLKHIQKFNQVNICDLLMSMVYSELNISKAFEVIFTLDRDDYFYACLAHFIDLSIKFFRMCNVKKYINRLKNEDVVFPKFCYHINYYGVLNLHENITIDQIKLIIDNSARTYGAFENQKIYNIKMFYNKRIDIYKIGHQRINNIINPSKIQISYKSLDSFLNKVNLFWDKLSSKDIENICLLANIIKDITTIFENKNIKLNIKCLQNAFLINNTTLIKFILDTNPDLKPNYKCFDHLLLYQSCKTKIKKTIKLLEKKNITIPNKYKKLFIKIDFSNNGNKYLKTKTLSEIKDIINTNKIVFKNEDMVYIVQNKDPEVFLFFHRELNIKPTLECLNKSPNKWINILCSLYLKKEYENINTNQEIEFVNFILNINKN